MSTMKAPGCSALIFLPQARGQAACDSFMQECSDGDGIAAACRTSRSHLRAARRLSTSCMNSCLHDDRVSCAIHTSCAHGCQEQGGRQVTCLARSAVVVIPASSSFWASRSA